MKKSLLILLTLVLCMVLCACGDGADTTPSTNPATVPTSHTHQFGDWTVTTEATCTEKGQESRACACGDTESRAIESIGHNSGAAATCTETQTCTVCGAELSPALGHDAVSHEAKAPTCTENGWDAYVTCSRCDHTTYEEKTALGHTWAEATCTAPKICIICWITEGRALGHTYKNGVCVNCGDRVPSEGLGFALSADGTSYYVADRGTCTDTDIIIPSTYNGLPVTAIGDQAFLGYYEMTSITIPNSVTSIGAMAFYYCSRLTNITIPSGVTSIGEAAFALCLGLTDIQVAAGNTSYYAVDGVLYSRDRILLTYPRGKAVGSVVIPNGVTGIGSHVFCYCESLTSITIPDSVTSIGDGAFYYCSSLTSITIPDSVTSIGDGAFFDCDSLTSIVIPSSVTSIGSNAFSECSSLTSITIPNSVTSIGDWAFSHCSSLTSITIPDSVTSIGDSAFYYCSSLTDVVIPGSVTSIGDRAFSECYSLANITIPDSVTSIGSHAFSYCNGWSLTDIYYGGTMEQWEAISKADDWDAYFTSIVYCTDGEVLIGFHPVAPLPPPPEEP